jgi:hypothetical protein
MFREIGVVLFVVLLAGPVLAQDSLLDLGLTASVRRLSEFEETELGLGARLSYRVHRAVALDGDVGLFPADLGSPAFSSSRREGLVGVRVGPHLGRRGGYLALRAGAVRFAEAPAPFPCILIFPPPRECAMGAGKTLPTVQVGAGFETFPGDRLVLRLEAGDQLIRYEGPAFRRDQEIFEKHLWSHNLKATVSVGLRF